ncbi:MAG TPA: secondary thiamine-phosphate synthase enzyme YjbQ [Thermoplasmata archaeon]|nr:secondary thiamine-phosphate synthase enzyme YjbQ [Thermoplasmata archaeon]
MVAKSARFRLRTGGEVEVVDITAKVAEAVRASGVREGIACVSTPGSTAAVTTIEHESGLLEDLAATLERLVPRKSPYRHNRGGDDNGDSHLRATLLGSSLSLPVSAGAPILGTWQQVVFVELDHRPREREVHVQVVGE